MNGGGGGGGGGGEGVELVCIVAVVAVAFFVCPLAHTTNKLVTTTNRLLASISLPPDHGQPSLGQPQPGSQHRHQTLSKLPPKPRTYDYRNAIKLASPAWASHDK